jgi:hypothetical protein
MRIYLHCRYDTRMPQPFLHKLPIDWFTILQVGTDENRGVSVPQNMWMQDYEGLLGASSTL